MFDLFELEFQITLLLPPISRGAHLEGPRLRAEQLVTLWKADGDVPLVEAFRLLDVAAVEQAIWRTLATVGEDAGDPRCWHFPDFREVLLPELRASSWQAMLAGTLAVEAVKGVRGKRHRAVLPVELPRLRPDWELSRLCLGARDEFVDVRVRHAPAEPVKKRWREPLSDAELKEAALEAAKAFPPGVAPGEKLFHVELNKHLPRPATREAARKALDDYVPHLKGRRGYKSKI